MFLNGSKGLNNKYKSYTFGYLYIKNFMSFNVIITKNVFHSFIYSFPIVVKIKRNPNKDNQ